MLHVRVLAALLAASIALRKDAVAFKVGLTLRSSSLRSPRPPGAAASRAAEQQQHVVQPNSGRRRPATSMSLLRTFEASELQLQRFIGELGFVEITDWEYNRQTSPVDPSTPSRTLNSSGTTVRLFEARTYGNAKVVLKEFLPKGLKLAYREIEINDRLQDAWDQKNGPGGRPPVLALMGSLVADESFKSRRFLEQWVSKFPSLPVPAIGSVWLVYRWEGLYTFASFPPAKQESEFFDAFNPTSRTKRRATFVKEMMRGAANALAFMHESGVVHRSLGASSLRVNTLDERYPRQLEVLLSDFGFATRLSEIDDETIRRASSAGATSPLAVSDFLFREDLYSLGYVFLELVFGAFCDDKSKRPDQNSLKRLLEDIFKGDFKAFKDYCLTEPVWEPAVEVLDADRGSGWGLATALLQARGTAASYFDSGGYGGDYDYEEESAPEGGPGDAKGLSMSMASTRGVLSLPYFTDGQR
ncbi:ATP binding protein, putative [Ectocarpus siliculosus]|uniref:ATP binding protein, putative n=1 Tax=Ectocarpus siliculosus TaxID=2880 RepID=D8LSY5_ECTSI|nr:ATP binding protein, putative [Ectocarpus siliculosus]|eukprot:CBN77912.1 ATP binding protein, putative [Ectocarpus siliculosus]